MIQKDLTKEIICKTIDNVYKENNDICITKLFLLVCKKLSCSLYYIGKVCGNFNDVLKELNINIPKNYFNSKSKKSISDGMKSSKKFQKMVHSEEHSREMSESNIRNFTLEDIKQNMDNKVKYERYFSRTDLITDKHRKFSGTVFKRVLRENNLSIDDFAKSKGVTFIDRRKYNKGQIGLNEKQILDSYQRELGLPIERQFPVGKYRIDGYVRKTNTPIEVDEPYHFDKNGNLRVRDIIRQNSIKNKLGCNDFVRIKDTSLTNIIDDNQKGLSDFNKTETKLGENVR